MREEGDDAVVGEEAGERTPRSSFRAGASVGFFLAVADYPTPGLGCMFNAGRRPRSWTLKGFALACRSHRLPLISDSSPSSFSFVEAVKKGTSLSKGGELAGGQFYCNVPAGGCGGRDHAPYQGLRG